MAEWKCTSAILRKNGYVATAKLDTYFFHYLWEVRPQEDPPGVMALRRGTTSSMDEAKQQAVEALHQLPDLRRSTTPP